MIQLITYLVAFSTVLFLIYKYLTATWDYWKIRGVKYEEPQLIFGNYGDIFLGKGSEKQLVDHLFEKYPNEKLVGLFHTRRPQLLVKDLELIRHVMIRDFDHFTDRAAISNENTEPIFRNLVFARSVKWRTMRKKLTPVFTSGKLKNMFPLIVDKVEEFQNYVGDIVDKNPIVDIRNLISQMTTDIIGSVIFGIETGAMTNTNTPFKRIGKRMTETTFWKTFKIFLKTLSPSLFSFLRLSVHAKEIQDFFFNTVRDIVKHRESTGYHRNDFMDLLIDLKRQNKLTIDQEETMEFDDMTMTAQAFIFFLAGFETSSSVIGCTLNELALNPDLLKKVVDEIDNVLKKHNGKINYDSISEMTYLEMCVYETMRKYPGLPTIPRVCTKKYTFPNTNVTIDKDIPVLIPAFHIHYNPEYYPDPHKYIPERFSPEERRRRDPVTFLGFGEGPRICIGLRFGKMQSMVGIVSVLSKFKIEACEKTERKIIFNRLSVIASPKNGIWLKITPRNK